MEPKVDSEAWKEPRCLVKNVKDGGDTSMQVNKETMAALKLIDLPLIVVAIAGLYRTGKSYLMNKLAGAKSGFALGNTVQAKTKGIWVWCVSHPTRTDCKLLLMDTEGLGDVEKGNANNDAMLFTLAALLSSTLVYNSRGIIDQAAIDSMHYVAKISESFKISDAKPTAEEDDATLGLYFPKYFIWVIRDLTLQLKIDDVDVTPDQYLEKALGLKRGTGANVTAFNMPRKCIRRYFPERKCFAFPFPLAIVADMVELESTTEDKLNPEFHKQAEEFCNYVFSKSEPKQIKGCKMNGRQLASLVEMYTSKISKGDIPSIETAVSSLAKSVNDAALKDCIDHYVSVMSQLKLPVDNEKELITQHEQCASEMDKRFKKQIMILNAKEDNVNPQKDLVDPQEELANSQQELGKKLADELAEKYKEICSENENSSYVKCRQFIAEHTVSLQSNLDKGKYHCAGGYKMYQRDFADICGEYFIKRGMGVKMAVVLQEYVDKMKNHANSIMKIDKLMSEQQRNLEEKRLELEANKVKVEELARKMEQEERLNRDHRVRTEAFQASVTAKLKEQSEENRKIILDIVSKLTGERERLRGEGAHEDIADINEAIDTLLQQSQTL